MSSKAKTLVILDTNKIRKNFEWEKDYSIFQPKGDFQKLIKFIEDNNLIDLITIGITEIVIEEVITTRNENFQKNVNQIKTCIAKLQDIPSCDVSKIKLPSSNFDYGNFFRKKIAEYINEKKCIKLIKLEKKNYSSILEKLIKKAIKKIKPFSEQDKGFKDALIWESIINYNKITEFSNIYMLTENSKDFDSSLEKEFNHNFQQKIIFESDTNTLVNNLENVYGDFIIQEKIKKRINSDYYKKQILEILNEEHSIKTKNLKHFKIINFTGIQKCDIDDFELEDKNLEDFQNTYKIKISLTANKKALYIDLIFDLSSNTILANKIGGI
ncbi:MAG: hypothetical protein ACTSYY_09195 [Promethearchaeota archaeon]